MGLWGVFIAPIIASCLSALVTIFNIELIELSSDQKKETADARALKEESPQISVDDKIDPTDKTVEMKKKLAAEKSEGKEQKKDDD